MLHETPETLATKQSQALEKLLAIAGSPSFLAKMLVQSPATIQGWVDRDKVSKKGAYLVCRNKQLKSHFKGPEELRPDITKEDLGKLANMMASQ